MCARFDVNGVPFSDNSPLWQPDSLGRRIGELVNGLSGIGSFSGLGEALEKGDLGVVLTQGGGVVRSTLTIANNGLITQIVSQHSNSQSTYSIAETALLYWARGSKCIGDAVRKYDFLRDAA
jgi:hypothetical protein